MLFCMLKNYLIRLLYETFLSQHVWVPHIWVTPTCCERGLMRPSLRIISIAYANIVKPIIRQRSPITMIHSHTYVIVNLMKEYLIAFEKITNSTPSKFKMLKNVFG